MTNPYNTSPNMPPNIPPTTPAGIPSAGPAPRWARKRYVIPAIGFAFLVGLLAGGGDDGKEPASASAAPRATATVTATATATATATETADPEPAATVTVRATRTVKTTVTAQPAEVAGGSDDSAGQDVYYANCTAARAAGAAPVRVGDPGYGRHLDRDGDGVGCE
ncbi:excalibur calcium-binding domain-containing protein [Streptomyces pseudovenezuelae]|uniref:Excalibur calcium-binding domain-containing protein n=1 Tax=Streptomyces pseudovenezuelae TaxID=67350 RepID=A0ABT6L8V8_9ACTN|nr:excalibur calcium-binding domain-containing protein [Streptomyces pseudovenezuelae]MDH6212753.1 hypothetical protein [Streptomyces pseudovenezuelae]